MTIPGLSLVPLTPEMASQRWLSWFRDPAIKEFIIAKPKTVAALRKAAKAWRADRRVLALAIMVGEQHIGNVKLVLPRPLGDTVEIGLLLAPEPQGRGIGPEVIRQAVVVALRVWPRVNKVVAGIFPENVASLSAFKRAGFALTGPDRIWAVWPKPKKKIRRVR